MTQRRTAKRKSARAATLLVAGHRMAEKPPVILVNIGADIVGRGDTSGRIGIGKALARLTKGTYLYADTRTLAERFPDIGVDNYGSQLAALMASHGKADFVLGGLGAPEELVHPHCYTVTSINETLSCILLQENELVAHNLTPAVLTEGAHHFKTLYPDIKGPLIAVLMADADRDDSICERLATIAAAHGEATIFLCGCRRTPSQTIDESKNKITQTLAALHNQSVSVLTYKYSGNDPANPYRGLIALADHFVVWGESQSLRSEALARGKRIYVHPTYAEGNLVTRGLAHRLNQHPADQPFASEDIPPVDVTEQVASGLLKKKKEKVSETCAIAFKNFRHLSNGEKNLLRLVAADTYAVTRLPKIYKSNPRFIEQAATINPLVLEFLTVSARRNPRIAGAALAKNSQSAPFVADTLLRDRKFSLRVLTQADVSQVPHIYQRLHPDLQKDREIYMTACRRNRDTESVMDKGLQEILHDDEEFMLTLIAQHHNFHRKIGEKLKQDPAFVDKVLAVNPHAYIAIPFEAQIDPNRAAKYFSAGGIIYILDERLRDNEAIARMAVETHDYNANHISDRLRSDPAFYLSLSKINSTILHKAHKIITDNARIMLRAISQDMSSYEQASARLRSNPHFILFALKKAAEKSKYTRPILMNVPDNLWERPALVAAMARITHQALHDKMMPLSACYHYVATADGIRLARALASSAIDPSALPLWFREEEKLMNAYDAYRHGTADDAKPQAALEQKTKVNDTPAFTNIFARAALSIKNAIRPAHKKDEWQPHL